MPNVTVPERKHRKKVSLFERANVTDWYSESGKVLFYFDYFWVFIYVNEFLIPTDRQTFHEYYLIPTCSNESNLLCLIIGIIGSHPISY